GPRGDGRAVRTRAGRWGAMDGWGGGRPAGLGGARRYTGVTWMRRLITRKVGFAVLGGIACLAAIAVIVIAVALQRAVDKAMAHAVIGGLAECGADAKASGIDRDGFPRGTVTVAFVR